MLIGTILSIEEPGDLKLMQHQESSFTGQPCETQQIYGLCFHIRPRNAIHFLGSEHGTTSEIGPAPTCLDLLHSCSISQILGSCGHPSHLGRMPGTQRLFLGLCKLLPSSPFLRLAGGSFTNYGCLGSTQDPSK